MTLSHFEMALTLTPCSFKNKVVHLIKFEGTIGFVSTFKKLKVWAFHILAGETDYKEEWFSVRREQGILIPSKYSSIFISLIFKMKRFERSRCSQSVSDLRLWLSYFNLYKLFEGPTHKGIEEELEQVFQPEPIFQDPLYIKGVEQLVSSEALRFKETFNLEPSDLGTVLAPTASKVAVSPGYNGTYPEYLANNAFLFSAYNGWSDSHHVKYMLSHVNLIKTQFGGNLHFLGGPGLKTRTILVPDLVTQSKLKPIQRDLMSILRRIPTDCTYNQEEGQEFLKANQISGITVYSVDLKSCTWNFPASLQKTVLKQLGYSANVISEIFHNLVYNPVDGLENTIKKGQAMGLAPSFPLFALTHNFLLSGLCKLIGLIPRESFRVLGDDLIINDYRLYQHYLSFCKNYEVPISWSKTIKSKRFGEFAGKVFFLGADVTPINWKFPTFESFPSLAPIYRKISPKFWNYMMYKDKKVNLGWKILRGLPSWLGGINDTSPVSDRIKRIRTTWVKSAIDSLINPTVAYGKQRLSTHVRKLPGLVEAPIEFDDALRGLSSVLEAEIPESYWSNFYQYTSLNSFLNQLHISATLLPFRKVWFRGENLYLKKLEEDPDVNFTSYLEEYKTLERELGYGKKETETLP
jgi:hypothetical protein